ncbi:hypothetical protein ACHQM5_029955 [Ranunculus cassubicifolius]
MEKTKENQTPIVPNSVTEAANKSLGITEEISVQMQQFLSLSDPEVLSQLSPLQRAQSLFLLAKASTVLIAARLRCSGVNTNDHPIKTELERLSLYQDKLDRAMNQSKAPLRPSATLNYQAATRFIEHSLPDLTSEQRQHMREISRGEAVRSKELYNANKKRKVQSNKVNVRAAAQEFLEKATRELLGDNKGDIKGPMRLDSSDEEDEAMN